MNPETPKVSELRVTELKEELRRRGLSSSGRKADLVSRLEAALADGDPQEGQHEASKAETDLPGDSITKTPTGRRTSASRQLSPRKRKGRRTSDPEPMTTDNEDAELREEKDLSKDISKESVEEGGVANGDLTGECRPTVETTVGSSGNQTDGSLEKSKEKGTQEAEEEKELRKGANDESAEPMDIVVDQRAARDKDPDAKEEKDSVELERSVKRKREDVADKSSNEKLEEGNSGSPQAKKARSGEGTGTISSSSAAFGETLYDPAAPLEDDDVAKIANGTSPQGVSSMDGEQPTSTVEIMNLRRPLATPALQAALSNYGEITFFWIDKFKTHCFVTYSNREQAAAAYGGMNGIIFPPETGQIVSARFVDSSTLNEKIQADTAVQAEKDRTRFVNAPLRQFGSAQTAAGTSTVPSNPSSSNVRGSLSIAGAANGRFALQTTADPHMKRTQATPPIFYRPLTDEEIRAKKAAAASQHPRENGREDRSSDRRRERRDDGGGAERRPDRSGFGESRGSGRDFGRYDRNGGRNAYSWRPSRRAGEAAAAAERH